LVREEDRVGLYERLLQEAAQEAEENPEREEQRRRQARKRQRMQAYVNSRRRAVLDEGGYVTSEEVQRDQDRYLADLQALRGLVDGGVRSMAAGYRLAWLRSKYPVAYARLRDIKISSE
jgi:multidrug resistance efflux pump